MVGRRIEISDNLGGFLVLVVVVTSVLFDLLHWVNELADIHAGRIGMLLQILTQLLQVVMEINRLVEPLEELCFGFGLGSVLFSLNLGFPSIFNHPCHLLFAIECNLILAFFSL
jgi:hypothetical protein